MTNIKQIAFLFLALLFSLAVNAQTDQTTKNAFTQVKRIYVEDNAPDTPKEESIALFLQTELAKQGFVVADNKNNADATLSGEALVQVTFDGDSSNPPDKAIYRYKLLSSNGELLWKTVIKFVAESGWTENNKLGAQRIAEKLSRALQKAKKTR